MYWGTRFASIFNVKNLNQGINSKGQHMVINNARNSCVIGHKCHDMGLLSYVMGYNGQVMFYHHHAIDYCGYVMIHTYCHVIGYKCHVS